MTMRLSALLNQLGIAPASLAEDPQVTGVHVDSRKIKPGMIFVAVPGTHTSGLRFISQAKENGAVAVVVPEGETVMGLPFIGVRAPRKLVAEMAQLFAGPGPQSLVGVTGTNGKSSTVDFLRQLWTQAGVASASIGTLGLVSNQTIKQPPPLTTPDAIALAETLAQLTQSGVTHVALEASSHGLEQNRLDGIKFTAAGFSNLTRDHLDYHLTMHAYREAKLRLFSDVVPVGAVAAFNADMDSSCVAALKQIAAQKSHRLRTVGRMGETLRLRSLRPLPHGQMVSLDLFGAAIPEFELGLIGAFQVHNVLLAAALAWKNDDEARTVVDRLSNLTGVCGRAELAVMLANDVGAYVDYAHTPDALENLLKSFRPHTHGRLIVVFGAGGDRDRGKRPLMGDVVSRLADVAIITDDKPRSENPATIRREIGVACPGSLDIGDREEAIAAAMSLARRGDVIIVAGKGHETGQTTAGVTTAFNDRAVIQKLAGQRA